MRTKVVSVLTVVALYYFVYLWSVANLPLMKTASTLQGLALVAIVVLSSLGTFLATYYTVKWLLYK